MKDRHATCPDRRFNRGGGEVYERIGAECEEAGFVARPELSELPLGEQHTRAGRAPDIEQCDIAEHTESPQVVDLSGAGLPRLVASRCKHDSSRCARSTICGHFRFKSARESTTKYE